MTSSFLLHWHALLSRLASPQVPTFQVGREECPPGKGSAVAKIPPTSSSGEGVIAHTAKESNKLPHTLAGFLSTGISLLKCCSSYKYSCFSGWTWPCWNWQVALSPWHCSPSNPSMFPVFSRKEWKKIKENFKLLILAWETEPRMLFNSVTFRKGEECCWVTSQRHC